MNARADFEIPDEPAVAPWSQELEQAVLGCLLLDANTFDLVGDILKADDFFEVRHKAVFEAVSALSMAGKGVDVITVFDVLQSAGKADDVGGLEYLNALTQAIPNAARARSYAEKVAEKSRQRVLIAETDNAAAMARRGDDPAAVIDQITSRFLALLERGQRREPKLISDLAVTWIDSLDELARGEVRPGISTGIESFDVALNGGWKPGHLYILAARPGVGKSSFAQFTATHAALNEGQPGLYLNLEMPGVEMVGRGVARLGRVDYSALQRGKLRDDEWARVSEGVEILRNLPLLIDDEPGLTLAAIRAKAMATKRRHGLRLMVLDYLQLCSSNGKHANRNGEIEEISRGLKALAKELGIAVIALSQLNREVERRSNAEPTLADLRDSGSIEQDADSVIFLWPCREFSEYHLIGATLAKNRQGTRNRLGLEFRGRYQSWCASTADVTPPTKRAASKSDQGFE